MTFKIFLAIAIDQAALTGSGGAQPTGIINTTGVQTLTLGTNGAVPSFGAMVSLESKIAAQNADVGSLAYMSNPLIRGYWKQNVKTTYAGSYGFIMDPDGRVNGYKTFITNNCPSNLSKGTTTSACSLIAFGNWQELIVAAWGGTDLTVDPYVNASTREINIYGTNWVDVGLRHPAGMAVCVDATTS